MPRSTRISKGGESPDASESPSKKGDKGQGKGAKPPKSAPKPKPKQKSSAKPPKPVTVSWPCNDEAYWDLEHAVLPDNHSK